MEEKKPEVKKAPAKKPAAKKPAAKKPAAKKPVEKKEPVEEKIVDDPGTIIQGIESAEGDELAVADVEKVEVPVGGAPEAEEETDVFPDSLLANLTREHIEPTIDTGIGAVDSSAEALGAATIVSNQKVVPVPVPMPADAVVDEFESTEDDEALMKDPDYMELWEEDLLNPSLYQYDPDRPESTIVVIVPPGWQGMQKRWLVKLIRMALWKRKEWHYKRRVVTHNFGSGVEVIQYQANKYNTEVKTVAGCIHNTPGLMERLVGNLNGPDDLLAIVRSPRYSGLVNAAIRRAETRGAEVFVLDMEEKYKK